MTMQDTVAPFDGDTAHSLARGLGWFSIALGLMEVVAPHSLARWLGMRDSKPILQTYGLREIGTGIGILASENPSPWVWGRVAGDGLDIATLAEGLTRSDSNKSNLGIALAAVAGVTALDVLTAQSLSRQNGYDQAQRRQLTYDYSNRSGFRAPASAMRGAARDFVVPEDMRTPKLLRPLATG
jgi:hypothetical protein